MCFVHFDLKMCFAPQRRALFRHLNVQKWVHIGVLCTFDLDMCFAPQRRALFRHLNVQKWSDVGMLCTFWLENVLRATTASTFSTSQRPKEVWRWSVLYIWLGNVLRATTACTFSTSQRPKVVWCWCALYILTWTCAPRHNGVHIFDISTSKSGPTLACFVHFDLKMCFAPQRRALVHLSSWPAGLRTRRFSEVTFWPSGTQNHWKNTVNRDFPTFSRTCIFLLLTLSLLWSSHFLTSPPWLFPPLLFHLSILSEVWLLNFFDYACLCP